MAQIYIPTVDFANGTTPQFNVLQDAAKTRAAMLLNTAAETKMGRESEQYKLQSDFREMYNAAGRILSNPNKEVQDRMIQQRITEGESRGDDMSDSREFLAMSPEQRAQTFEYMGKIGSKNGYLEPDQAYGATKEGFIEANTIDANARGQALVAAAKAKLEAERIAADEKEKDRQNELEIAKLKAASKGNSAGGGSVLDKEMQKSGAKSIIKEYDNGNEQLKSIHGSLQSVDTINNLLAKNPTEGVLGRIIDPLSEKLGYPTDSASQQQQLSQSTAEVKQTLIQLLKGAASDKDLQAVEEAAGKLSDPNVSLETRKQVAKQFEKRLKDLYQQTYKRQTQLKAKDTNDYMSPVFGGEPVDNTNYSNNTQSTNKSGGVVHVDAQGNKAIVYPDGTYDEIQ